MKADDPLVEVFERNRAVWEHKKVLIAGQITSMQILPQLIGTEQAWVVTDNFETAQGLSAMMGAKLGRSDFESITRKHVHLIFADCADERLKEHIEPVEVLVLFLNKTKSLSQNLLFSLQDHLTPGGTILLIGANSMGGKSADSLVKGKADCYKLDTARKCTVFSAVPHEGARFASPGNLRTVSYGGLELEQSHGLFSQGELDGGTLMLLNAMHRDLSITPPEPAAADAAGQAGSASGASGAAFNACGKDAGPAGLAPDLSATKLQSLPQCAIAPTDPVLDLGCGSGIIGLSLAARGLTSVVCSDISATALRAAQRNAASNGQDIKVMAANMLPEAGDFEAAGISIPGGKFKVIATNPPFHQGASRTTAQTLNMIAHAREHLTADGVLYLVGNNCLHYEEPLNEAFDKVEILASSTKFTVFKASASKD